MIHFDSNNYNNFNLFCSGDPPFTFKWVRNNGSTITDVHNGIDKGLKVETSQDYAILSIESVQVSQAGNYTCFVSNEGDEQSYTSTLRVNGKDGDEWNNDSTFQ